ncbi:FAD-dependent oxidoreductase [Candidatus Formimonas warabiya]|uniref:FAD-dependent oxidoreductase n=1 Tax=Formimonas warabiya TaxID=1761012 RepID=A0A3G1KRA1_FORW1|nr:FAD-dependent oxidoreductase [Candidatus Formimonas warabiya]ATW24988.1 hypothetical protein DCMF_09560 [Candidatus Formimonas warabiya]
MTEIGLFTPIRINAMELPNRIVMSPAFTNTAGTDGGVTDGNIKHYVARAHSGVGLIIIEHTSVNSYYIHPGKRLQISKDEHIDGLRKLVDAVHREGSKIAIQLAHSIHGVGLKPADLSRETVFEIVADMVNGARRAVEAGFDGSELHFAHTYTLADFLSRRTNKRTDEFGGDIFGRMRIHLEIIKQIREVVGPDYPLLARFDAEEFVVGGNTLQHTGIFAGELEKAGIDCLDVSVGVRFDDAGLKGYSDVRGKPTIEFPDGPNVYFAEAIKKLVKIPVMTVGKLGNPQFAESVIREGRADLVALARPLIADTMWVEHVRQKRDDLMKECLYCSECLYERHDLEAPIHCMRYTCQNACPANVDVPVYVDLVGQKKYREAYQVIQWENPLGLICGRVCNHPCESLCNRVKIDAPIAIRLLKRFAADRILAQEKKLPVPPVAPEKDTRVAIIGSGPSGLTCAFYLRKKGYQVTVFEKLPVVGGMLAVGIPGYRLPKSLLAEEVKVLREMGVKIQTNVTLGQDIRLEGLKEQGYQAIYLALGTHKNRPLQVEGEDYQGVYAGVNFLRDLNLGKKMEFYGKRVAVIGGGNVAIDVARSLTRMGIKEVQIFCLESREEMPAYADEVAEAVKEGVMINNGWGPRTITGKDGKVTGITLKSCTSIFDRECLFNPAYDENRTLDLEIDRIVVAIGQVVDDSFDPSASKIKIGKNSLLEISASCATSVEGVFAGGDCVSGPSSVVEAVKYGKEAALSLDRYLGGDGQIISKKLFVRQLSGPVNEDEIGRPEAALIPPESRKGDFAEVEEGLTEKSALVECRRCLRCDVLREIVI